MPEQRDSRKSLAAKWWQFSLRSLLILLTLVACGIFYGGRFWQLTQKGYQHQQAALQCREMINFWNSVSFHVPQEEWIKNQADHDWHTQVAAEYYSARWLPWRKVRLPAEDSSDPATLQRRNAPFVLVK